MKKSVGKNQNLKGLNIVVTGADGFVSSHLCDYLVSHECKVLALIKRNSSGIFKNLNFKKKGLKIKWGDTQDLPLLLQVTKNTDIVFHLAAQSHVGYSLYNPFETYMNDVTSTLNILESARINDIKRIVHAGSSEIYGKPQNVPIDESHPLSPRSPYAAAKASSENLLQSYFFTYGLPVVMSRFFNIYGPRQGLDQAIPKFILQAINDKPITIYGDGNQTRDYTFVSDAVKAYVKLGLIKKLEGQVLNIGSGKEIKIKDLARTIITLSKSKSKLSFDKKLRSGETPRLLCNNSQAKITINWKPETSLIEGLKQTIDFYKERPSLVSNLPFMT